MQTKNLLEELMGYVPEGDQVDLLQTRGDNALNSAINLFEFIDQSFSEDEANDLTKRFLSALRNRDSKRWKRGVEAVHESKRSPRE